MSQLAFHANFKLNWLILPHSPQYPFTNLCPLGANLPLAADLQLAHCGRLRHFRDITEAGCHNNSAIPTVSSRLPANNLTMLITWTASLTALWPLSKIPADTHTQTHTHWRDAKPNAWYQSHVHFICTIWNQLLQKSPNFSLAHMENCLDVKKCTSYPLLYPILLLN